MYIPETVPKLSEDCLHRWSTLSYIQLVKEICALFIEEEIPTEDLSGKCTNWNMYVVGQNRVKADIKSTQKPSITSVGRNPLYTLLPLRTTLVPSWYMLF